MSVSFSLPAIDPSVLGQHLLFFVAGLAVPTRYGVERIEGFGRFAAAKLPYKAPPGKEPEQALSEAVHGVEQADGVEQDGDRAE